MNPKETTSFKKYGDAETFVALLGDNGYTLFAEVEGQVKIYRK